MHIPSTDTRTGLALRSAVADDLPAIRALYAREVDENVATYEYTAPDEAEIRHFLRGNLCRCTGYVKILDAVRSVIATAGGQA